MKMRQLLHDTFEFGISIKLINGLWEIIGGIALFFISPQRIAIFTRWVSQNELLEDPRDLIGTAVMGFSNHFSVGTKMFAAFYLMAHGIINIFLFSSLQSKKQWAYPVAGFILIVTVLYEIARLLKTHSKILFFLVIVDLAIIALLRSEYKRVLKSNRAK